MEKQNETTHWGIPLEHNGEEYSIVHVDNLSRWCRHYWFNGFLYGLAAAGLLILVFT